MNSTVILSSLLGGAAVYLVFAACGSGGGAARRPGGDSSVGGSPPSSAIPDAQAQGANGTVSATELCSKLSEPGPAQVRYAEHLFPGRTAIELTRIVAVEHIVGGSLLGPAAGYNLASSTTFVQDGKVAVFCGFTNQAQAVDSVTFLLSEL